METSRTVFMWVSRSIFLNLPCGINMYVKAFEKHTKRFEIFHPLQKEFLHPIQLALKEFK